MRTFQAKTHKTIVLLCMRKCCADDPHESKQTTSSKSMLI